MIFIRHFNVLLNLASVCNTENKSVIWYFISRYLPDVSPENSAHLDKLVEYAVNYFRDFIKPIKSYRLPSENDKIALIKLQNSLKRLPNSATASDIQEKVYEIGKLSAYENLRDWFKALYEILLGQSEGPRLGSFIKLYGIKETIELIEKVLSEKNSSVG